VPKAPLFGLYLPLFGPFYPLFTLYLDPFTLYLDPLLGGILCIIRANMAPVTDFIPPNPT